MKTFLVLFFLFTCFTSSVVGTSEFTISGLLGRPSILYDSLLELAFSDVNADSTILPNTTLIFNRKEGYTEASGIQEMINFNDENYTFVIGNDFSFLSVLTGIVGNVYGIAQLSPSATSTVLSDVASYPYFSRISPPTTGQIFTVLEALTYYSRIQGRGWTEVGLISTTDAYGIDAAAIFIEHAEEYGVTVTTYQQYIGDAEIFDIEIRELENAGARVICAFVLEQWGPFISAAGDAGLVGDGYVWFTLDAVVGLSSAAMIDEKTKQYSRGVLGTFQYVPDSGEAYDNFLEHVQAQDPAIYPELGPGSIPGIYDRVGYDMVFTAARTVEILKENGDLELERIPAETWVTALRSLDFEGLTAQITFDELGDIRSVFSLSYYDPDTDSWIISGLWSDRTEFTIEKEIIWNSGTTDIPDLDFREPFNYWSCHSKEMRRDSSGKEIRIHTPDGSNIDDIDSVYHCDHFIDCHNLSDESYDCSENFMILFIVFGIIVGLFILLTILLIIFVIFFGIILGYRRLRVSSPAFLLIILFSILVGYFSIYAWFGKPHPVACAFQPWLLGLPVVSMVSALCVKIFRIWRIFSKKRAATKIADWQLFLFWVLMVAPAIFILTLWTIISTPTASMEERDGEDHYVCNTGGFTGEPGGIIFFSLLAAYTCLILLFGIFLSIVTRKVPSLFNESKLMAISIYNLVFLSIVIVPVFIVVDRFNPFLAWIIRTMAILYAFTATLLLQFAPPLVGIVLFDRMRNIKTFKPSRPSGSSFSSAQSS